MLTLESLAARLASDPDFRTAFAADPQAGQGSLAGIEQSALNGQRDLLALAPDRLLARLLGNPESETDDPPEWGMPPTFCPASHA